ncbi:MAG: 3-ketoacyl-ACP reductase [Thermoguttaceae bacterium]|jgi:NAD(P)-dependent dehydrogenase (short-subunit alcohol dehydrogenase family)
MKRVALVTGGARGIGLGISQCLAREGIDLAVCGVREEPAAAESLEILRKLGAEVLYVQADVGDAQARRRLVTAVEQHFGCLNVLVNNAGVAPKVRADLLQASEESFVEVLRTNLQGPYFLTQAAARWMIAEKKADAAFRGCIVNVSSISATVASVSRGDYCVSKAGVSMATQLWAARLGEFDLPVYEVRPGVIRTDMTSGVVAKYDKLLVEGIAPQARWGQPDDVGKAVAALVRGDFPYSTGAVIMVDGGLTVPRL